MKVLSLGSLNIDKTYSVDHITQAKETQAAKDMHLFPGGKGLNQSISMSSAGLKVFQAGCIGEDGELLLHALNEAGVDCSLVRAIEEEASGHAIIQVDTMGQNSVMIFGGANHMVSTEYIDEILEKFSEDDVIVLQNEISNLAYAIERAHEKGMTIVLNPSPFNEQVRNCDLQKVSMFFINEVEGRQLTTYVQPGDILIQMQEQFPNSKCVLTLGPQGAFFQDNSGSVYQPAIKTQAIDTTAAGDIFEGFFLAAYLKGKSASEALKTATAAAAISVSRKGAAMSAPKMAELAGMV